MEVTIDTYSLDMAVRTVPGRLRTELRKSMHQIGSYFIGRFQRERLSGNPLHVRSGFLRRSFRHVVEGNLATSGELRLHIFTIAPYARIHEYGGTIRPVKAGALTIPMTGGPAHTARAKVVRGLARSMELHLQRTAGGSAILADEKGRGWFVLRDSVTIPARLGLRDAWKRNVPRVISALNNAIYRALEAKG